MTDKNLTMTERIALICIILLSVVVLIATAVMPVETAAASKADTYTCEFAGFAEVENGTLTDLQVTKLECK